MKNLFEKSAAAAKQSVHLHVQDKAKIREALFLHMENNPVKIIGGLNLRSWKFKNLFAFLFKRPLPVFSLFIALVVGISTTYAAENSLPGDFLYPVKVNVNENIHSFVAITDESKASWDVERAERRLNEAQKLSARGRLSVEVRDDVEARFKFLSDRAEKRIEKLKANGNIKAAAEVNSRFESALRTHDEVLSRYKEKENDDQKKVKDNDRGKVDIEVKDRSNRIENFAKPKEKKQDRSDDRREDRRK